MKRFLITFFLITFCIVGYFAYTVFSKREIDFIKSKEPNNSDVQKNENVEQNFKNNESKPNQQNELPKEDSNESDDLDSKNVLTPKITSEDCINECKDKKNDELLYCKNICGLSDITSESDCENLDSKNKDYCYKNQAVEKSDSSICDKISDSSIKKLCKNRIQEDVLENM